MSSTRRSCSCRARSTAAGSPSSTGSAPSSSTCCRRSTSSGSTRPTRCGCVGWTWRRVTSSRPRCPIPRRSATRMRGKTCAGTLVTGKRKDGGHGAVYLYHVADNERTMREYGHQAVVLQTALNPVVALELLAAGTWEGTGVLGPESFPPDPFLELLADYGEPHGMVEGDPRRP